jgi:DNA/RNA endonuclease YhcR with UshA esterase domain
VRYLVALLLIALVVDTQASTVIAPAEAADHVGQLVTVSGRVEGVYVRTSSGATFINFGAPYPNHVLNAVIFKGKRALFPGVDSWKGKTVEVTGKVQLYKDKPEIILNTPVQVTVEGGSK